MPPSRREFVALGSMGVVATALSSLAAQSPDAQPQSPATPGAPPAFGTAPPVGPEVSAETFRTAEKLVNLEMNDHDLAEAASNWRMQMAPLLERRVGPRKLELKDSDVPATQWNPELRPGAQPEHDGRVEFVRSADPHLALPAKEEDIAYAPVTHLSRWIESRQLTSERLTQIYIRRIERFDAQLHCVITLARDHALE